MPVDHVIGAALRYGYTHHIERLMVLGNFPLLAQTDPAEVYRWFMGMYVDAYDWVMVPNVYGMSQFADGGCFATKPYISGANYLRKMSDYPAGDWEPLWTALYWKFLHTHKATKMAIARRTRITVGVAAGPIQMELPRALPLFPKYRWAIPSIKSPAAMSMTTFQVLLFMAVIFIMQTSSRGPGSGFLGGAVQAELKGRDFVRLGEFH